MPMREALLEKLGETPQWSVPGLNEGMKCFLCGKGVDSKIDSWCGTLDCFTRNVHVVTYVRTPRKRQRMTAVKSMAKNPDLAAGRQEQ